MNRSKLIAKFIVLIGVLIFSFNPLVQEKANTTSIKDVDSTLLTSQVEIPFSTLLTNLEYPKGLWVKGNKIYLTETNGRNTIYGGKICLSQYDTITNQTTLLVNNPLASDAVVVSSDGMIYLTSYQNSIPGQNGIVTYVDPNTKIEQVLLNIEIASKDMFIDTDDNILIIGSSYSPDAKSIYLLPVGDYTHPSVLQTGLGGIWCISKNGGDIYFSDHDTIKFFSSPGGTIHTFLGKSVMSMSFSTQYLYYADYFGGTVGRIKIQTKVVETLISNLTRPIQIRYEKVSKKLYFLEAGTSEAEFKDGTLNVCTLTDEDDYDEGLSDGVDSFPFEIVIGISVISGGAVIGVATLLLIRRKRKRIE